MLNIVTNECDFEIANLYFKKVPDTVVNSCCVFRDQTQIYQVYTPYEV